MYLTLDSPLEATEMPLVKRAYPAPMNALPSTSETPASLSDLSSICPSHYHIMVRRYSSSSKTVRFAVEEKQPETMSLWLQRQASSHSAQLAATAVLSGAAVAGAIFGIQALRRQIAVEDLKASIPGVDEKNGANGVSPSLRPTAIRSCRMNTEQLK